MSEQQPHIGSNHRVGGFDPDASGYNLATAAFDFSQKTIDFLSVTGIGAAVRAGKYVWIDLDYSDPAAARDFLASLRLVEDDLIEEIFTEEAGMQLARHTDYMHLVISGCRFDSGGTLGMQRIDTVIDEDFFLTVHQGPHQVIDAIKNEFEADFVRHAQTPSFLVYELWDALVEHYADIEKRLEHDVENLQTELVRGADDEVFTQVSGIGENLLHFRGILMPARNIITELASRRSHLISDATQEALHNIGGTLEKVLQDVLVDREILTQSLSLHMSMVSHHTNRAMSKLTVVSAIFLPLTFLCGVYGMNFTVFPELHWKYGYDVFWATCAAIVVALLFVLRRYKLL